MDEEKLDLILERIEKLEKKVEDNNSILHSERNAKRWVKLFTIIKWIIIIILGILAWSYIQPIYTSTMEAYNKILETSKEAQETFGGVKKSLNNLSEVGDKFSLENLKKKLKNKD